MYDTMMSHVPYGQWVKLIESVGKDYLNTSHPSVFELGGGTGTLGSILVYEGFEYAGSDISPAMCREAWKKGLDYLCCDCRALPLTAAYDMVVFCFDGINYLSARDDYRKTFLEVYNILKPGGLFLFDITTERTSRLFFNDYTEAESTSEGAYIRYCEYNRAQRKQYNTFDIFCQDEKGTYLRYWEEHVQTIFSPTEILSFIPRDYFSVLGMWGDYEQNKYTSLSDRVHFLLQKED
jgi:SAM-dependent methyltransferase